MLQSNPRGHSSLFYWDVGLCSDVTEHRRLLSTSSSRDVPITIFGTDHLESVSADPDITDHSVKSINSSIYSVTVAALIYLTIPLTQHWHCICQYIMIANITELWLAEPHPLRCVVHSMHVAACVCSDTKVCTGRWSPYSMWRHADQPCSRRLAS